MADSRAAVRVFSDAGGLPELNLHGVTGFMDKVGDIEGMAAHAIEILKDDEILSAFKENALKRAQQFDLSLILPLYEEFYKEVMDRSHSVV